MPQSSFVTVSRPWRAHLANPDLKPAGLLYGVALVLGFLGIKLPFASAELSPLTQWMLFLSLGVLSHWSAFSHAVYTDRSPNRSAERRARFRRRSPAPILASAPSLRPRLASRRRGRCSSSRRASCGARRRFISPTWCATRTSPSTSRADLLVGRPHPAHASHCAAIELTGPQSGSKWIASQIVGGSSRVHVTRCRQWAGSTIQSPSSSARSSASPSIRSLAAPATTSTNSSRSWSYHSPSGVVWPVETMRSTRSPERSRAHRTFPRRAAGWAGSATDFPEPGKARP
jgi:hypothetical protein